MSTESTSPTTFAHPTSTGGAASRATSQYAPAGTKPLPDGFVPPSSSPASKTASGRTLSETEKRLQPRYEISRSLMLIPVLPTGAPHVDAIIEGLSTDISLGGIGILAGPTPPISSRIVVGIETSQGGMQFATAIVRHTRSDGQGLRLGAQFVDAAADLLRPDNVSLHLDATTFRFATRMSADVLQQWAMLGVTRPRLIDWIQVCPKCEAIPTFRYGCPECGSSHMATSQLIHHFACAHVGMVHEFERNGALTCPKCRQRHLVVGADFEHLTGPYKCLDCGWFDGELVQVAQCLRCRYRFLAEHAVEREQIEYHVDRLDPLAFVAGD